MKAARFLIALLAIGPPAAAQQVVFDKPVRAGDLVMFRDVHDEKAYYYAPTRPRLASDANGLPQFSFFRWVENVRTGPKEAEAREGEGGGIVHALVTFGVTKDQLTEATRDLERQVAGAKVAGPIVPESGVFTLVSSMANPKDPNNKLSTQVLGVGNAPILDGDKAAVSITLTKLGAKVMWEQFQTPTPDVSFSFEMTVNGFLGPIRATIEANLDEVVKHDSFAAGIAGNFFGAQIKGAFDDLRRTNVIKVTQVGEDAKFNEIIKQAYDKLVDVLFEKTSPAAAAAAGAPQGGAGGPTDDWITKATTQLGSARDYSDKVRKENVEIEKRNAERKAKRFAADEADRRLKELETELHAAEAATDSSAQGRATQLRAQVETARQDAASKRQEAIKAGPDEPLKDSPAEPGFALMGTYQLKRSHQSGMYRIDLSKSTAATRKFRFDENIGDLRPLYRTGAFRQVNLDDPLYKQREIVAIIDGVNAEDFGQYINFVSLRLRKTHESGEITNDEIRIDRKNFNQEGANFKMLYGWKGDNNRQHWMDYEYQTVWSFFGGYTMEMPWRKWSSGEVPLAPPLQRRSVELQGDPKRLAEQSVRAVSVKVFYRPAADAPEQVKQVTLNAAAPNFAGRIDFVGPKDSADYEYEIAWRLAGNREVTTGRQKTSFTILNLDDVPASSGS